METGSRGQVKWGQERVWEGGGEKRNGQTHCREEWEKMPSFVDDTSHKEQEMGVKGTGDKEARYVEKETLIYNKMI